MVSSVIVCAPQGAGKSLLGRKMAGRLGMERVVDGWMPGDPVRPGDLCMTSVEPENVGPVPALVRVMTFGQIYTRDEVSAALAAAGLDAPTVQISVRLAFARRYAPAAVDVRRLPDA